MLVSVLWVELGRPGVITVRCENLGHPLSPPEPCFSIYKVEMILVASTVENIVNKIMSVDSPTIRDLFS